MYIWIVIMAVASVVTKNIRAEEITSPTIRISPPYTLNPPHSTTTKSYTTTTSKKLTLQAQQPLTYHGGPVINNPRVYLVFWGSQWNNNDPSGEASIIINFMNGVGGSAWLNVATQYCSGGTFGSTTCTGGMYLFSYFFYNQLLLLL